MTAQALPPKALWREFHWAFFLNVQGLIICLRRFELTLARQHLDAAEEELNAASVLLVSSAAAMELASSFTPDDYEGEIRPSMTPPAVASDDFSGLMSWEHAALIGIWRELRPAFADLPDRLAAAHRDFVAAYRQLASRHSCVCARFVGQEAGSLRFGDNTAIETLRRFERGRLGLIDPARKGCPIDP